jgi:hypothetical protein
VTVGELAVMVALIVDCGCCAIDHGACKRVAEFVRSQHTDIELQDEEVMERVKTMIDDLYNYDVFNTGVLCERAANQN